MQGQVTKMLALVSTQSLARLESFLAMRHGLSLKMLNGQAALLREGPVKEPLIASYWHKPLAVGRH
jgi:hypothetical protein